MIAAWMASSVLVGLLATIAALAIERVFTALRRPVRWIWLAAIAGTAVWPLVALVVTRNAATTVEPANALSVQQAVAFVVRAADTGLRVPLDLVLMGGWIALSLALCVRLTLGLAAIAARRRDWNAASLDGARVWLSGAVGPAVIGVRRMEVVLPKWVVELDRPLRDLILRHESEHMRARDPYLLWAATIARVLLPWNVALWMQARRLRLAVELDCDARVLRAEPNIERYGLLLIAIAQRTAAYPALVAPALIEPRLDLERRIQAMQTTSRTSRVRLAALTTLGAATIGVACSVDAPVEARTANAANAVANGPVPVSADKAFYEFQVEQVARAIPGTESPTYPLALRSAGISGRATAQFVVGTDSLVDMTTVKVVSTTHPEFGEAVRAALPRMRFSPAKVGGRPVKQLLQIPFEFSIK